jgi:hypothetical protein
MLNVLNCRRHSPYKQLLLPEVRIYRRGACPVSAFKGPQHGKRDLTGRKIISVG